MVQRLTYRRRHSYATRSNKVRKVKTPGAMLAACSTRTLDILQRNGSLRSKCQPELRPA